MLCDLHIHSLASGHAFNTVDEITEFALKKHYRMIGFAEHGPDMEGAPHLGYFEMLRRLPKRAGDMIEVHGCEANILNTDGIIDIPPETAGGLDYVIAGLHRRTSYKGTTEEEHTEAVVSAIRSGVVDIISHPVSSHFVVDPYKVVKAAAESEVILEANKTVMLNAVYQHNSVVVKAYRTLLEEARRMEVPILFGSDAHHISEMGLARSEKKILTETYGLNIGEIFNTQPEKLICQIKKRRMTGGDTP